MKIVLVNKYYAPFYAPTARYLNDLAVFLANEHETHVITGSTPYVKEDSHLLPPREDCVDKVHVHRLWCWGTTRKSFLGRLLDYASFYILVFLKLIFIRNVDVVVVLTTPPFLNIIGYVFTRFKRIRLVLWNMDTYPDIIRASGMVNDKSIIYRCLRRLAKLGYSSCERIIVLDQYMHRHLENLGVQSSKIAVCSNWEHLIPESAQQPARTAHTLEFRHKLEIPDDAVVFLYSGNLGLAHDVNVTCQGMKRITATQPQAYFVFSGNGLNMAKVRSFAKAEGLQRVIFLGYVPYKEILTLLLAGDVGLISMKADFNGLLMPSKIYNLMAMGLPVLYIGPQQSEIADVIHQGNCGLQVADGDIDGFVAACEKYINSPELRKAYGRAARTFFMQQYEISKVLPKLARLVSFAK